MLDASFGPIFVHANFFCYEVVVEVRGDGHRCHGCLLIVVVLLNLSVSWNVGLDELAVTLVTLMLLIVIVGNVIVMVAGDT